MRSQECMVLKSKIIEYFQYMQVFCTFDFKAIDVCLSICRSCVYTFDVNIIDLLEYVQVW